MKRFSPYLYLKAIEKRGITLSEDFKAGFTLAIGLYPDLVKKREPA